MASTAVILANGGSTYYAVGNVNGKLTETGTPYRPILSPGLRDALAAKPEKDLGDHTIIYWSAYEGALRSCMHYSSGELGFGLFAHALFQDYAIVTVFPRWPEPQDGGAGSKAASPRGLETFAKGAVQTILNAAREQMSGWAENPFGDSFSKIGQLLQNPAEFIKSNPLMKLASDLDAALRPSTPGASDSAGQGGKDVWCLPSEVLDQDGPYGPNEIYTPRNSGGGVPTSSDGERETKDDTLTRLIDTISDLVDKFVGTPDDQRQPGTPPFDKLLPLLKYLGDIDDVLGKLLGIPKLVPELIMDTSTMLQAISDFVLPLLKALGLSNSDTESDGPVDFDYKAFWEPFGIKGDDYKYWASDVLDALETPTDSGSGEVGTIYGYEFWQR